MLTIGRENAPAQMLKMGLDVNGIKNAEGCGDKITRKFFLLIFSMFWKVSVESLEENLFPRSNSTFSANCFVKKVFPNINEDPIYLRV